MSSELISTWTEDHVFFVRLERPERRNAVNASMALKMFNAFTQFENDPNLRVGILCASGEHFCAGADLSSIASGQDRNVTQTVESSEIGPMGPTRMLLSKPVIAAISGFCVAGGLELACWCDLRVADENAIFGVFCRRWGVPLIDGGSVRLPRLIGQSRAMDMILTGRPVLADEALLFGLVNRVVPAGEAMKQASSIAKQIASFPQLCMRADRMSSLQQWNLLSMTPQSKDTIKPALALEYWNAQDALKIEANQGAARFALAGEGRHGSFAQSLVSASTTCASIQPSSSMAVASSPAPSKSNSLTSLSFASILPHFNMDISTNRRGSRPIRAVLFDLGGVVLESPIDVIEEYTHNIGLPRFSINRFLASSHAFKALEAGLLGEDEFFRQIRLESLSCPAFIKASSDSSIAFSVSLGAAHSLSAPSQHAIDFRALFRRMASVPIRHDMLAAVSALRSAGYLVAALTNNWKQSTADARGLNMDRLDPHFHLIFESCVHCVRKPSVEFFQRALAQLHVSPQECIFLDDIRRNVLAAQQVGIHTIHVPLGTQGEYRQALQPLFAVCTDALPHLNHILRFTLNSTLTHGEFDKTKSKL